MQANIDDDRYRWSSLSHGNGPGFVTYVKRPWTSSAHQTFDKKSQREDITRSLWIHCALDCWKVGLLYYTCP
ncbi:hypothetical protein J5N97_010112 [Dioscorea zingiberensis]|uniref:Uncharacterized protein n=1 Tax=Dioscorea zingiberensis TaxID=325984 RepID=A0A9D5HNB4_9LILI|nr:hypothetical protein J5N97_010112 [Dioscorea zingiberensis]